MRRFALLGALLIAACTYEVTDEVAIPRGPGLCPQGDGCRSLPLPCLVEEAPAACLVQGDPCGGAECCNGVCDTVTGTCP
jgi:hypothetical protein